MLTLTDDLMQLGDASRGICGQTIGPRPEQRDGIGGRYA